MAQPKVSIIIPIYNTGRFLPECVDSVRNQTLQDIEIILVDDESPDNSPQLCDEYARQDERIKVVHKRNGGLGFARNSGLDVATGEYVSFIDSDDFISLDMMEKLYSVAKKYDADDVRSGTIFYNNGKKTIRRDVEQTKIFSGPNEIKTFIFDLIGPLPEESRDVKYMMSVCLALHKRSLIEENHIRFTSERETLSEDFIFDLDIFPLMSCIVYIPDCFYHYRMNPISLTHSFSMEKYKRTHTFFKLVKERLKLIYNEEEFKIHYLRLMFMYLRGNIGGAVHTRDSFYIKMMNIKTILNDDIWTELLTVYPYQRMEIRHRFYFFVLRHRWVLPIMIANRFFT